MHGRKKADAVKPSQEELDKQRQQVATYRELLQRLLKQRKDRVYNTQTMELTGKALQFNPEFPTLWSYRREILDSDEVAGDRTELWAGEMRLLEGALRKSQKVYSIWFHRKWVVEKQVKACESKSDAQKILDTELALCGRLLEVDERNFHCWNHRAHVMGLIRKSLSKHSVSASSVASASALGELSLAEGTSAGALVHIGAEESVKPDVEEAVVKPDVEEVVVNSCDSDATVEEAVVKPDVEEAVVKPDVEEAVDLFGVDLKLSKDLINRNFSNYSAWHLRALLQQSPLDNVEGDAESKQDVGGRIDIVEELEWVQQGIYTEPNDQSIWLYHHWLTLLNSQHSQLRITHCAILDRELIVFFSGPACVRAKAGSNSPAASVSFNTGGETSPAVVVEGNLVPLASDVSAGASVIKRKTRRLGAARARWALAWKFTPLIATELEGLQHAEVAHIEASVEVVGSNIDGSPSRDWQTLSFDGPPVRCACPGAQSAPTSRPLLAQSALIPPKLDGKRVELLDTELSRVRELLDLEPDCKWALLSRSRLEAACATRDNIADVEKARSESYDSIGSLDPLRVGFYREARSRCVLHGRILTWLAESSLDAPLNLSSLALRRISPSSALSTFGVRTLNVEFNELREFGPLLLLHSLEDLNVSNNKLAGDIRETFVLPRLKRLNVSHNSMTLGKNGVAGATPPGSLKDVDVSGNAAFLKEDCDSSDVEGSSEDRLISIFSDGPELDKRNALWTIDRDCMSARCLFHRE